MYFNQDLIAWVWHLKVSDIFLLFEGSFFFFFVFFKDQVTAVFHSLEPSSIPTCLFDLISIISNFCTHETTRQTFVGLSTETQIKVSNPIRWVRLRMNFDLVSSSLIHWFNPCGTWIDVFSLFSCFVSCSSVGSMRDTAAIRDHSAPSSRGFRATASTAETSHQSTWKSNPT